MVLNCIVIRVVPHMSCVSRCYVWIKPKNWENFGTKTGRIFVLTWVSPVQVPGTVTASVSPAAAAGKFRRPWPPWLRLKSWSKGRAWASGCDRDRDTGRHTGRPTQAWSSLSHGGVLNWNSAGLKVHWVKFPCWFQCAQIGKIQVITDSGLSLRVGSSSSCSLKPEPDSHGPVRAARGDSCVSGPGEDTWLGVGIFVMRPVTVTVLTGPEDLAPWLPGDPRHRDWWWSISRTFYANNRWLRRPGPWPSAEAVTHTRDVTRNGSRGPGARSSRLEALRLRPEHIRLNKGMTWASGLHIIGAEEALRARFRRRDELPLENGAILLR